MNHLHSHTCTTIHVVLLAVAEREKLYLSFKLRLVFYQASTLNFYSALFYHLLNSSKRNFPLRFPSVTITMLFSELKLYTPELSALREPKIITEYYLAGGSTMSRDHLGLAGVPALVNTPGQCEIR